MAGYQQNRKSFFLQTPPLLRSESAEEFNAFCENLNDEIKPQGPIERMYADEFAYICWDILRFRRAKAIMIDVGSRRALERLLQQIESNSTLHNIGDSPEEVSWLYFRNASAKQAVLQIMELCQLDETAIAAQAIQDALSQS
jgi:uncharacterized protein YecE (DUF72 family)